MQYLNITPHDVIWMVVFAAVLIGISLWAQSFRKRPKDILSASNYFFVFSGILLVLSIGSLVFKGVNLGMDFTGGTMLELKFSRTVNASQLSEAIAAADPLISEPMIQMIEKSIGDTSDTSQSIIRLGRKDDKGKLIHLSTEQTGLLIKGLGERLGKVEIIKSESIGPVIGNELMWKALGAIFLALLLQLIYITLRFGNQTRFGLAADIALAHDLVIMVGIYSLVGREMDSPFIAALLTVIGYSVMDSIVIFDRVRENLKVFGLKKYTYKDIINMSLNQTMTRSINTLLSVLLVLFALYFFGGATLRNFAFALLIGCASGAYSSIFIASPLLMLIDNFSRKREQKAQELRRSELEAREAARREKAAKRSESRVKRGVQTPLDEDYPSPDELVEKESSPDIMKKRIARRRRKKR
ncbi:MAG: protein translocase subunit SecF [Chloroflexi bacterium]|nr:protein translocase subunit SecF [Chloroflexota bacterium]